MKHPQITIEMSFELRNEGIKPTAAIKGNLDLDKLKAEEPGIMKALVETFEIVANGVIKQLNPDFEVVLRSSGHEDNDGDDNVRETATLN